MAEAQILDPDLNFIREVGALGGEDLKKCYQCATCSVACAIAPDNHPFPRKEMIAASWGLKDKLVKNGDIWLCHNCGDCSTKCPRTAKPGDVLAAVRAYAVSEYAVPKTLAKAVNNPKNLPFLLAIPAVVFLVLGLITGLLDFTPEGDMIVYEHFFSTWLVDIIFIPLAIWNFVIFANGIKRFLGDIHENAVQEGKTNRKDLNAKDFIVSLIKVIPTILKHNRFNDCTENNERSTAHMMVFFSFIGLFVVTSCFFISLYILQQPGPYSQLNPLKWLANVSGICLIVGSALLIRARIKKPDQVSTYKDWALLGLVLALGLTGMCTEIARLIGIGFLSYFFYFIHLMSVFSLFAYLPFSKLAHLVYRTLAIAYADYSQRGFKLD
ncbi:MAG: quinone-interacting membrane-bound oxidoreductase complex subunit QmoC [Deltaproteobacteria bacterium]|nr:quinone-interacting membrane-bound oxidoreductase complex subunit QmoC [Deltaproteobacteria bacterium]MBW1995821.1 quinone-interacting membrane-bound oxidoreductase complex subunit QmoC [Deltaproteobacteria bacterium]MBW2150396.1 quinone-interacting membrane-bound oxidoreductase complex subunit QmoC [Deltaproteobacteria bacterium]